MTQYFVLNPATDCIYYPCMLHLVEILFSLCSLGVSRCMTDWCICCKSNIRDVFLRQLLSHSLLTSGPVRQPCKISVYIKAWQQCSDISISHVTTWNDPVKRILCSVLTTFAPQPHKVIGAGMQTRSTARILWCNFNNGKNNWQWVQFPGFVSSCTMLSIWNVKICSFARVSANHLLKRCKRRRKKRKKNYLNSIWLCELSVSVY